MNAILDDIEMDLCCPGCGQEFQETIGRLKYKMNVACPGCHGLIEIKGLERLDGLDRAVWRIQKTINYINRRR